MRVSFAHTFKPRNLCDVDMKRGGKKFINLKQCNRHASRFLSIYGIWDWGVWNYYGFTFNACHYYGYTLRVTFCMRNLFSLYAILLMLYHAWFLATIKCLQKWLIVSNYDLHLTLFTSNTSNSAHSFRPIVYSQNFNYLKRECSYGGFQKRQKQSYFLNISRRKYWKIIDERKNRVLWPFTLVYAINFDAALILKYLYQYHQNLDCRYI